MRKKSKRVVSMILTMLLFVSMMFSTPYMLHAEEVSGTADESWWDDLTEGKSYTVPVKLLNFTNNNATSMGNGALTGEALLYVKDGVKYVDIGLTYMTMGGASYYLTNLWYFTDPADAGSTDWESLKVEGSYTKNDSNKVIGATIPLQSDESKVSVAIMSEFEAMGVQRATLSLDYSKLTEVPQTEEITAPVISTSLNEDKDTYTVSIATETEGADIYYTYGSEAAEPEISEANKYTAPFTITRSSVSSDTNYISAVAVKNGITSPSSTDMVIFEENSDSDALADGTYSISGEIVKTNKQEYSMANDGISHDIKLVVKDGKITVFLDFQGIEITNMFGYLGSLSYFKEGYSINQYGEPVGETIPATVLSTQKDSDGNDIIDEYNDADNLYPNLVSFPLAAKDVYVPLQVNVPIMEAIGNASGNPGLGTQKMYLKLNWDTLKTANDEDFTDNQNAVQSPAVDMADSFTGIKVNADKGVFPEGVELSVKPITQGTDYDKAIQLLSDAGRKFKLYDISMLLDGTQVQPNGLVKVSLPIPAGYDISKLVLYRINDDGTKTLISGSVENGYYIFYVNHFSQYALVEKGSTVLDSAVAKTGDNTPVVMMSVSTLLSFLMAGGIIAGRRKKI